MAGSAVDTVTELLQNLGNPEVVRRLVATDAVYVSLNQDNPELKQILPWTGTHHGPSSFTDALGTMFTWWANELFEPTDVVGDDDRAAIFGTFRYRSHPRQVRRRYLPAKRVCGEVGGLVGHAVRLVGAVGGAAESLSR